eukprot:Colp12_sorted_trinity150504_noHs@23663
MKDDQASCLAAGMDSFIPKPLHFDALCRLIKSLTDPEGIPVKESESRSSLEGASMSTVVETRSEISLANMSERSLTSLVASDKSLTDKGSFNRPTLITTLEESSSECVDHTPSPLANPLPLSAIPLPVISPQVKSPSAGHIDSVVVSLTVPHLDSPTSKSLPSESEFPTSPRARSNSATVEPLPQPVKRKSSSLKKLFKWRPRSHSQEYSDNLRGPMSDPTVVTRFFPKYGGQFSLEGSRADLEADEHTSPLDEGPRVMAPTGALVSVTSEPVSALPRRGSSDELVDVTGLENGNGPRSKSFVSKSAARGASAKKQQNCTQQ